MKSELILVIDIGTSSVRSALYDRGGKVLLDSSVKNERTLAATDDGGAEIDADEALRQVVKAIDDVLAKPVAARSAGKITHVAASSFWHSLVGIDARGRSTTKVFGWADTRSRAYVELLNKRFADGEVHNRTGAHFHSSYWPAKLLYIRDKFPKIWAKTDRWLSFSDLVMLRLCGAAATSVSMASGTGIFDIRKCEWDAELLRFLKINFSNLANIAPGDDASFQLTAKYQKRWPRLAGALWLTAIGDGAANNIGVGCATKSKASLMVGTSGALRVAYRGAPPEKIPHGLWCYRIDRRRVIIGGALSDGGGLYRWLKDTLKLDGPDDSIEADIASRPPAAHHLVFLPFLAGERSTGYHASAAGAVVGLRSATDAVDIVQAALESVAYRFAEIFDQLKKVCRVREIIASGGALRASPVWTQIIADVLGHDLIVPKVSEASSRGAALLALETIGVVNSLDKIAAPRGKTFAADSRRNRIYAAARKDAAELYKMLISRRT